MLFNLTQIKTTGKSLLKAMPDIENQQIDQVFNLTKPKIDFKFDTVGLCK